MLGSYFPFQMQLPQNVSCEAATYSMLLLLLLLLLSLLLLLLLFLLLLLLLQRNLRDREVTNKAGEWKVVGLNPGLCKDLPYEIKVAVGLKICQVVWSHTSSLAI